MIGNLNTTIGAIDSLQNQISSPVGQWQRQPDGSYNIYNGQTWIPYQQDPISSPYSENTIQWIAENAQLRNASLEAGSPLERSIESLIRKLLREVVSEIIFADDFRSEYNSANDYRKVAVVATKLDLDGNRIVNLPMPQDDAEAAPRAYVDNELAALEMRLKQRILEGDGIEAVRSRVINFSLLGEKNG